MAANTELAQIRPVESSLGLSGSRQNISWYIRWSRRTADISASQKQLVALGYCAVIPWLTLMVLPDRVVQGVRLAYLFTSALFLLVCALRRQIHIRLASPVVFAIALQTWSFICGF